MENTNLENLNRLAKLFGTDRLISPEDIQEIRSILIGVLANNKKEVESLTEETKQAINAVLDKVLTEHDTYLEKTKQMAQEAKSDVVEAIKTAREDFAEVKRLAKEIMDSKPKDGEDADEEYVIGEVLNRIKLPEYKEVVLDDGGAIVDKINSLPVNEENQIDAKHIKNLPEVKGGRVISGGVTRKIVEQMIEAAGGGGGSPGGSDTQVQFNDGGSFGGDAGLTYNKTTDSLTIGGNLTVDTDTLFVNATNNVVGIGTASPLTQTGNRLQVGDNSAANQYLVFQTNNSFERGIQYYLQDGTTLRGFMKWDGNEDLLLKGDVTFISTGNVSNAFTFMDGGGIGLMGIGTTSPTHSLTLNSTSTGIALYNTADQTTNFERGEALWTGNEYVLRTLNGGTGTSRPIKVAARNSSGNQTSLALTRVSTPFSLLTHDSTGTTGKIHQVTGTSGASSSTYNFYCIEPTINQSTSAGYTALLVNPTETTTGGGTKLLADFQVGGTSRFSISNGGETTITRQVTGNYIPLTLTNSSTAIGDNVVISMRPANLSTGRAQIHAIAPGGSDAELAFFTSNNNASPTEKVRIDDIGNVGIGQNAPTAYLHIKAGAAAAESAPLKLTSGTNLTTPENGAVEYDGTSLYFTPSSATRRTVVLDTATQTLTNKTLTSPTLTTPSAFTTGGTITLAENTSIALDPTLSADGTYTGVTIAGTAGATLAFGDLVYLAVADSRWELVDADAVATAGAVLTGMCVLAAASDGSATTILLHGNIRADANFPALTVGAPVYASTTPGDVQTTAPSGEDDIVVVLGYALTADSMFFSAPTNWIVYKA